jgi:hypothetical protein
VQILFGAIIIPYGFLIAGVVQQATNPQYAEQRQAVYASALLLALMTVYTASTVICLWVFHCVQAQESEASRLQEVEWQPHDMMFFLVGACGWQGDHDRVLLQLRGGGYITAWLWLTGNRPGSPCEGLRKGVQTDDLSGDAHEGGIW